MCWISSVPCSQTAGNFQMSYKAVFGALEKNIHNIFFQRACVFFTGNKFQWDFRPSACLVTCGAGKFYWLG
jgi:hypothetical protein